jgi:putative two-component system response regulator
VVDDLPSSRDLLARCLAPDQHVVNFASDGQAALDSVRRDPPDIVLMDVMMPGLDGIEVCRALKDDPDTRLVPVVLVTASVDTDRIRGIEAGADDFLSKPFNRHELRARVRSLVRIKRFTDDLDTAEAVIISLALTIEARDPHTEGHCQRLARYANALGRSIGLSHDEVMVLTRGAYLHDIGKIGVPDAVLLKPGRLTSEEYEQIKQHTVIGDHLCGQLRVLRPVRPIVRHHHERLDGSGYPDGLRGDAIPLLAQIIGIVDVFDALTTSRPYKAAFPVETACDELLGEASRGWRRLDLVNRFVMIARSGRVATAGAIGEALPSALWARSRQDQNIGASRPHDAHELCRAVGPRRPRHLRRQSARPDPRAGWGGKVRLR